MQTKEYFIGRHFGIRCIVLWEFEFVFNSVESTLPDWLEGLSF